MRRTYRDNNHHWGKILVKMALTVFTTAVIVWFLPRSERQTYKYDLGKPWTYGAFIAQFDFPIYKSEAALQHERDSLTKHFAPFFSYDESVGSLQIVHVREDAMAGTVTLKTADLNRLCTVMTEVYEAGIVSSADHGKYGTDSIDCVRLIMGNSATSTSLVQFPTVREAYERIVGDGRLSAVRQQLSSMHLEKYIEPNIIYDTQRSKNELNELLQSIPVATGMVQQGQKIIDRGEIVDAYAYNVLSSFDREMLQRTASPMEQLTTLFGQIIFVLVLVSLYTCYLTLYRQDYFDKPGAIIMVYLFLVIFPTLVSLIMAHKFFSVYILPMAMVPIFIRVFMDSRTAFLTHVIITMICAAAVKYQYEFIIIQLCGGLVAIYTLRELSKRSQVFMAALTVSIMELGIYRVLQLMEESDSIITDLTMDYHFILNGVLLLSSYPLMFLVEKVFGFVSNVTLFELSDTNKGLLRQLSEVAPGTLQHSITVGNLASEIAQRIGCKALLVRTGALYHDIGKMDHPVFFTENQTSINPHKRLSEKESAKVIISHVTNGLRLAERNNLPTVITDFIRTHHGAGQTKYFYIQYKNNHPDEEVDVKAFSYPGPNPFTTEQAILMMADAVEAASRSLPEYTQQSISQLVENIIEGQVKEGYFRECPITFRDIAAAKAVLIENLMSIYHTRIAYPKDV